MPESDANFYRPRVLELYNRLLWPERPAPDGYPDVDPFVFNPLFLKEGGSVSARIVPTRQLRYEVYIEFQIDDNRGILWDAILGLVETRLHRTAPSLFEPGPAENYDAYMKIYLDEDALGNQELYEVNGGDGDDLIDNQAFD